MRCSVNKMCASSRRWNTAVYILIRGKSLLYDRFHMQREREPDSAEIFFSWNSTCHTNNSYRMCNIVFAQWCVTLCLYGHRFNRLREITYCYNHLIDLQCKPVHYVSTDTINASICIRIRRILKVGIRIRSTDTNFYEFCHITSLVGGQKSDVFLS